MSSCDSVPVGEGKQRVSLVMIFFLISFLGFENENCFCSKKEMKRGWKVKKVTCNFQISLEKQV